MNAGTKDFCAALSCVLYVMAAMCAVAAAQSGSRIMYIQTAITGILALCVTLAILTRL